MFCDAVKNKELDEGEGWRNIKELKDCTISTVSCTYHLMQMSAINMEFINWKLQKRRKDTKKKKDLGTLLGLVIIEAALSWSLTM